MMMTSVQTRSFSGPNFPVVSPNRGKYGPEKLRIWTFLCSEWKHPLGTFCPKNKIVCLS